MPADQIKKTKLFERNFWMSNYGQKKCCQIWKHSKPEHCQGLHWWFKTKWESRSGFLCRIPKQLPKTSIFPPWNLQHCVPGRSFSYSEVAKNLLLDKMHNQSIVALVDSQAAIKALIKCTVTSITVLNCIRNLNQLGKQNHVSIEGFPGHAGVHGNEVGRLCSQIKI